MTIRHRTRGAAALALLAALAAGAAAQQPARIEPLSAADSQRFIDLREGKRPVKEAAAEETQKNVDVIRRKAALELERFDRAVRASAETGSPALADFMRTFASGTIVDRVARSQKEKPRDGQLELVNVLGKEMTEPLAKQLAAKSPATPLHKLNAAILLSILARTGYDKVAEVAVAALADPAQHDAVKLYMLQALYHLFAVQNPDDEAKSVFTSPELEEKAIRALIDFIARKPALTESTTEDEVNGLRFVRREAVRALGQVRKPVVRDKDGKVVMVPGVWLLRVANGHRGLVPAPSLSERVEALVGYLQLQADKETNMDFAAGHIATAVRDLAVEYQGYKPLVRIRTDKPEDAARALEEAKAAAADETKRPRERDYLAWRLSAGRIAAALRVWRENWEHPRFGARPEDVRKMMADLTRALDEALRPMSEKEIKPTAEVTLQALNDWLKETKFLSTSLYNADPTSTILRPEGGR